jgi:dipeptidyl aminopeptidase/acylaminoacyl peptidase
MSTMRPNFACTALLIIATCSGLSQPTRTLKGDDVAMWESLGGSRLSNDGAWFACTISRVEGDGRMVIRETWGERSWVTANANLPLFSEDSKFAVYSIGYGESETERMRKENKPIENTLGVRNLEDGSLRLIDSVQAFSVTKNGFLLAHRYRGRSKQSGGSDLLVSALSGSNELTIGNVRSYSPSSDGRFVLVVIESDSGNNGIQLVSLEEWRITTIEWGKDNYRGITWNRGGTAFAFIKGTTHRDKDGDWNVVVIVKDALKPSAKTILDPKRLNGAPEGLRIVEHRPLSLSDDASTVLFGMQVWSDRKPEENKDQSPDVDVWHWLDIFVQPRQRITAQADKNRSMLFAWKEDTLLQISDDKARDVAISRDLSRVLLRDETAYRVAHSSGTVHSDFYVVDVATGSRRKVLENVQFAPAFSHSGSYITHFDERHWWIVDLNSMARRNITGATRTAFHNTDWDYTAPQPNPAAPPVWFADDAAVMFFDNFDAWIYRPISGSFVKVTSGSNAKKIHRYVPVGVDPEVQAPRLGKDVWFSVRDWNSKATGYTRWRETGNIDVPIEQENISSLQQAANADVFTYTYQTAVQSPNFFAFDVPSGKTVQLTETNPQQRDFAWTRSELISYRSKWGKELHGVLLYPANYDPRLQYPMIVYIYERLSNGLNSYPMPSNRNAYNQNWFTQNGYFVYMPDLTYRDGNPGISAKECIEPALDAVFAKGIVDRKRVGLMGHSWGGYQTAFLVGASNYFAAGVAGAPLTNLISMYGSIYWNSGTPDQELLETGQGRLIGPYWEDLERYIANSPIFQAQNIKVPLLIAFGDNDGAVDWNQGVEMYITMRRLAKEVIMLVFPGENHGLARRPNQIDYAKRVRHFFDVHLKGARPDEWLKEGVPFLRRGEGIR